MIALATFVFTLFFATIAILAGHEYGARVGDTRGLIGWWLGLLVFLGGCCFAIQFASL